MGFERIVVTTDFSEASQPAADVASHLARRFRSSVTLAHSFDPTPLGPAVAYPVMAWVGQDFAAEMERETEELLAVERDRAFGDLGDLEVEIAAVGADTTAVGIAELARKRNADLVVVGSHGHTGMSHLLLGSVAQRVVRFSPCSVLCVHPELAIEAFPRRILVATDFSPPARAALRRASVIAEAFDADVTLLHVYDEGGSRLPGRRSYRDVAEVESDLRAALEDERREHFGDRGRVELVVGTSAAATIAGHAQTHGFDLIVVGTLGRTGLSRMVIGSVAEQVVFIARGAVMAAR